MSPRVSGNLLAVGVLKLAMGSRKLIVTCSLVAEVGAKLSASHASPTCRQLKESSVMGRAFKQMISFPETGKGK